MDDSDPATVEVRALRPADRPALESFACATFKQPWSREIEEAIRILLPDLLDSGDANALGLFCGTELCGVIVWTVQGRRWFSTTCATATGHRRRHYGSRLKRELLARAHDAGAITVASSVDYDNAAMLKINEDLGAAFERDPLNPKYMVCVFRLR